MKLGLISVDGAPTLIAALDDGLAGSQNDWSAITVPDLLAGSELAPPAGMIDLINGADRFLPALQVALDRSRSDAVGRSIEEDQSTIGEVRSMYADDRPTIGDAQSPYGDDRRTIGEVRSTNADDQSIIGEVQSTYRDDQHTIGEVKRMYARDRRTIGVVDLKAADWLPPQPDPRKILGVAFNNRRIRNDVHVDPGVSELFPQIRKLPDWTPPIRHHSIELRQHDPGTGTLRDHREAGKGRCARKRPRARLRLFHPR